MRFYLGVDDAGRGPLVGPMLMAGVLVDGDKQKQLKRIGCKDSKQLTAKERENLFEKIKEISLGYHVVATSPTEIDNRTNVGLNLNRIEAIKTAEIINEILKTIKTPEDGEIEIIVDCPSPNTVEWRNYLLRYIEDN